MRCEAIRINEAVCACKIQGRVCSMKERLLKLLRGIKNILAESPAYSYDRERAQREAYKHQVHVEFYRRF